MVFNLTCLVSLEEKGAQLLAGEKVSIVDLREILKGPRGLRDCGTESSLHLISPRTYDFHLPE